jgi:multiple sugar transport system substrate-binding protein
MHNGKSCALSIASRGVAFAAFAGAVAGAAGTVGAAGVLDGQTIRILAIGDPVFQVMQKIHGQMEEMAGGKIELEVRPFDVLRQQVLLNAQNATSNYDIIAIDLPQFGEYKQFLTDLNPLIQQSGFDGSDFHEVAWTGAQFGGQQLGIPIQPHPEILAYRKDLFEEAGLKAPETTDDVLAAAEKLHGSREGLSGICWNAARGTALGQTFIQVEGSFGQAPIDLPKKGDDFAFDDIQPANMKPMIDTPAGHATANYLKALMDFSPPGILNMAWDERVRVFAQGGCAMTYIWSGRSAIYELDESAPARGKVGYMPHPHGPGAPTKSTLGGWYLGIPTNLEQDRVPLAWKTIEWLTSQEMMKEYTKHGDCVSPRHSVSKDGEVIARCPVIPEVDQMASAAQLAGWQRPPVPELQQIVDVLGSEMHEMLAGKKSPDDAVVDSQEQIDRIMIKAGYY